MERRQPVDSSAELLELFSKALGEELVNLGRRDLARRVVSPDEQHGVLLLEASPDWLGGGRQVNAADFDAIDDVNPDVAVVRVKTDWLAAVVHANEQGSAVTVEKAGNGLGDDLFSEGLATSATSFANVGVWRPRSTPSRC